MKLFTRLVFLVLVCSAINGCKIEFKPVKEPDISSGRENCLDSANENYNKCIKDKNTQSACMMEELKEEAACPKDEEVTHKDGEVTPNDKPLP